MAILPASNMHRIQGRAIIHSVLSGQYIIVSEYPLITVSILCYNPVPVSLRSIINYSQL